MTSKSLLTFLLCLGVICPTPVFAQEAFLPREDTEYEEWDEDEEHEAEEDEEIPEPSQREILNFLTTHLPEALPLLERVREEESYRDYQEVLERAAEIYIDHAHALREGAIEEAQLILDVQRAELRLEQVALAWHDAKSRADRERYHEELAIAAAAVVDLEIKVTRNELTFLERETRELRRELSRLENGRESLIAEIVRDMTDE